MLVLNCKKVTIARGIYSPIPYLRKHGLPYHHAHRLMVKNFRIISLDVLEKLCLALNCTPNDLLEWTPDSASQDTESTSLQMLKPGGKNIGDMLSKLPYNKLSEIVKIISEPK